MAPNQLLNAYKKSETQSNIHPVKLIHMIYERVLVHLEHAEAGTVNNDPQKRGENLGKAIALITELNASIKEKDDSEAARFLRGLYSAILVELPKVSISNDAEPIRQAYRYIERLRDIWEQTAMRENGFGASDKPVRNRAEKHESAPQSSDTRKGFDAVSDDNPPLPGVSLSI